MSDAGWLGAALSSLLMLAACSGEDSGETTTGMLMGPPGAGSDLPASDCEGRGTPYVPGMTEASSGDALTVTLLEADPAPPAHADNFWQLKAEHAGEPLAGATIVAVPWMVDHGHGAASQLATEEGDGLYELGPLALTMAGYWEITLEVSAPDMEQQDVLFSFCVPVL